MKYIRLFALITLFISLFTIKTYAQTVTYDGKSYSIPDDIPLSLNVNGIDYALNTGLLVNEKIVVYGTPADVCSSSKDYKNASGQIVSPSYSGTVIPRYWGYNLNKGKYTNIDFPPDVSTGTDPKNKKWITRPWKEPYSLCESPSLNSSSGARETAQAMLNQYGFASFWTPEMVLDRFVIQTIQGNYTNGSLRGYHDYNGQILYQTLEVPPLKKPDIKPLAPTVKPSFELSESKISKVPGIYHLDEKSFDVTNTSTIDGSPWDEWIANHSGYTVNFTWVFSKDKIFDHSGLTNPGGNVKFSETGKDQLTLVANLTNAAAASSTAKDIVVYTDQKPENQTSETVNPIITAASQADVGKPFPVKLEKTSIWQVLSKVKSIDWYVSTDGGDFTLLSEQSGKIIMEFQYTSSKPCLLQWYAIVHWDTDNGSNKPYTQIVDSPTTAKAEIASPDLYYEGLYEGVGNLSTFTYKDVVYGAEDANKKGIGSSFWKFFDLDKPASGGRLQPIPTDKYQKQDWQGYKGGKLRFFEIGNKQLWLQARGRFGNASVDTKNVQVIALPKADFFVIGAKKNREVDIFDQTLFKPKDACLNGEKGEIDNSKTTITITNVATGEKAVSVGGQPFNSNFVKGLSTKFGVIDQGDYTHISNNMTAIVFVGDDEHDQKTEVFNITLEVSDYRGHKDSVTKTAVIYGDLKPVARLTGITSYLRSPADAIVHTDLENRSYSPDLDPVETSLTIKETGEKLSQNGIKVLWNPTKTGTYTLEVTVTEKWLDTLRPEIRALLNSYKEKSSVQTFTITK